MEPEEISAWVTAGKGALDLMRSAWHAMPKGEKKDELEAKVKKAEDALQTSSANLAKSFGYKLCQCTFPPQIMLWQESTNSHVCPNPACDHRIERRPTAVWRSDDFGG
jgi:hypothetical protein